MKRYIYFLLSCSLMILTFASSCNVQEEIPDTDTSPSVASTSCPDVATEETAAEEQEQPDDESLSQEIRYYNSDYQMFYGEWEATGQVFVERTLIRGTSFPDDVYEETVALESERAKGRTIKLTYNEIVVDGTAIEVVDYHINILPADDDFKPVRFTLTFKDMGILESEGSYYAFVYVKTKKASEFYGSNFFVKDENTLIVRTETHCVEYTRKSYDDFYNYPWILQG